VFTVQPTNQPRRERPINAGSGGGRARGRLSGKRRGTDLTGNVERLGISGSNPGRGGTLSGGTPDGGGRWRGWRACDGSASTKCRGWVTPARSDVSGGWTVRRTRHAIRTSTRKTGTLRHMGYSSTRAAFLFISQPPPALMLGAHRRRPRCAQQNPRSSASDTQWCGNGVRKTNGCRARRSA